MPCFCTVQRQHVGGWGGGRGGLQLAPGHQGPESVPAEMFAQLKKKVYKFEHMNEPGCGYLHSGFVPGTRKPLSLGTDSVRVF